MEQIQTLDMKHYVDPAILEVITLINLLPFVSRTLWCCAGYGPHAPLTVFNGVAKINRRQEHCPPYVVIQSYQLGPFHDELRKLVWKAKAHHLLPMTYVYHLLSPRHPSKVEADAKEVWSKIRELICSYSIKE